MKDSKRDFWEAFLIQIIGTALGVLLTLGTGQLISQKRQAQSRKMTAMMVLSNIESFSHSMEEISDQMARLDTVTTWLLAIPNEQIPQMDQRAIGSAIVEAINLPMITYDNTAQNIFSSNLSTWENLGNFRFIDQMGKIFYQINWIIEYWEKKDSEIKGIYDRINRHPDDYPGENLREKFLRDKESRTIFSEIHSMRNFLDRNAVVIRTNNRIGMRLIGITEQEVNDFTDNLKNDEEDDAIISSAVMPWHPRPSKDSLFTMPAYK